MREHYDLVVIGAGPAGLAAASEASSLGLATLLLDEQAAPGGQIYRAIEARTLQDAGLLSGDDAHGTALAREMRQSGTDYLPWTTIFDISPDRWLGIDGPSGLSFVHGDRVLIATGALERPFPISGWTLPGVMTAGAAQILLKTTGAVTAAGTVLAGTGPLLYLLAAQLLHAGGRLDALLDTTEPGAYRRALTHLPRALGGKLLRGLGLLRTLRRAGVRHLRGVRALRAEGGDRLESVVFSTGGAEERLPAALLLLHQGVVPNIQISQALRLDHTWHEGQLCFAPTTDGYGETSTSGIFIAGDGAGIEGAEAAAASGRIAALQIACQLGRIDAAARDARMASPCRVRRRERRLRPFLETLYRPADAFRVPAPDDVLVCRCEEVSAGQVREGVRRGAQGPNQLKAFLRCGMGPCQGRLCGLTVCETIAAARRISPAEVGYYRLRPPIKPVALGALAAADPPHVAADADAGEAAMS
jgi:NADPH-dependent 2,4-dienoyl-CoA reductase/sulfur reductase-like enzyme